MDNRPHWLTRAAQRAGLPGADTLAIPASVSVAEAWSAVAQHCGVDPDVVAGTVARVFRLEVANLASAESTATVLLPAALAA